MRFTLPGSAVLSASLALAGCTYAKGDAATCAADPTCGSSPSKSPPRGPDVASSIRATAASLPVAVMVDAERDAYLVAYQDPAGGGHIARFSPGARRTDDRWAGDGVLVAPSGLAASKGILYVSDQTALRRFDEETGQYLGSVPIPGAVCLEGVSADLRGTVYVVDSGLSPCTRREDVVRTVLRPGSVVRVEPWGEITTLLDGETLHAPKGISYRDGRLWVSTSGANEVFAVDGTKQKTMPLYLPTGDLEGIVQIPGGGGDFLVVSQECNCIYRGGHDSRDFDTVAQVSNGASLAYDSIRERLLVADSRGVRMVPVPRVAGPSSEFEPRVDRSAPIEELAR